MGKPILCLDFDGVIHGYDSGWKGARNIPDPPVPGAIEFIFEALLAGWDVVVHSSRARYWGGISAMRAYIKEHAGNIYYDTQAGVGLENVRFTRWKPSAMVTLDDRALTFKGEWPDLDVLKAFKPWNKNPELQKARERLSEWVAREDAKRGRPLTDAEKLDNIANFIWRCDECDSQVSLTWKYCASCGANRDQFHEDRVSGLRS